MSQAEVTRPESIDDQERTREDDKKPKSRRPANTAFRQQRLKAWQPILTPKSVLPLFFIVGVIFAPIGGVLLWASSLVQEISIDYSECSRLAPLTTDSASPVPTYSATFKTKMTNPPTWQRSTDSSNEKVCHLTFTIPNELPAPVFMYYRLTNFYQNHRRYVQSLDLPQLKGDVRSYGTLKGGTCDPIDVNTTAEKPYYPCGLIANSMFNDTIGEPQINSAQESADGEKTYYNMTNKGIAWQSDKDLIKQTKYKSGEVLPPPNWGWAVKDGNYTELHEIHENEEFLVWMRTAGLPSFSKLSRRQDTKPMPEGQYSLTITDRFNVTEYAGTKSILISTRTALGGKNPFMGIAYVVVGGVCVLLGALFTVAHLVRPRKLGDHTYLTWDSSQPSTATATGRDDRFGSNGP